MTKRVSWFLVSSIIFASSFAFAHDGKAQIDRRGSAERVARYAKYKPFLPDLEEFAREQAEKYDNGLPSRVLFLSEVLSDRMVSEDSDGKRRNVLFRENEVNRAIDLMVRRRGKFPLIVGEVGTGKTAVAGEVALRLALGEYQQTRVYTDALKDVVVLKTPMRNFAGGMDINAYLSTVRFIRENLKRKIAVMFTEAHFANDYMVSVLRDEADKENPIPILLEVDNKSYGTVIKGHPSFTALAEPVMVREPNAKQLTTMLEGYIEEEYKEKFAVDIGKDVLAALIDVAPDYRRDIHEPLRSDTLLEDFMIFKNRESNGKPSKPSRVELYRFVASQLGLPVIPQNEEEFAKYMQGVKERMKKRVIGQKAMVDGIVDQFIAALTSRSRTHNIALALGPTGVGKSLIGEILAEEFYGDKTRLIELDMTQYKDAHQMSSLFGANNGLVSSDKEKGVLCDFFDGRGKGGGIVIMNEIEEMSSDALTRFMEMWDKGWFPGGDGKPRYVGRTLFILTSNKNSDRILSHKAIRGMVRSELDRRLGQITQDQLKKAFTEKASYTEDSGKQVKAAILERVDRLYFASPLLQEEAAEITQLEIDRFLKDFHKQSDAKLTIDPTVAEVLTSAFYNETLGARQIRTNVQQYMSRAVNDFRTEKGFKNKELKITAKLHPALKTVSYITIESPKDKLTIDGPKIPVANKLLDAEFRQRLIDLEKNMKTEIFGQDEAIAAIAGAAKSRYLEGDEGTTVAGFLLGVTGSGKSELAKVLAKYLYGRKEAMGLFEMGRVQHQSDLNTILSPGKGIIGSDQPGELEQFLIDYPDGGVLLFDEMSNAGGDNKALKAAIAKQFYTMMQEGYYKSPSGKKYPLHNHIIIFTGNDGEEEMRGMTSDSQLEETYQELMKNPGFVKSLLSKAGFTDAFIGRLGFSHFMRPTLGQIKILIAKKLINEWKETVEKNQPINLVIDEAMYEEIGTLMFSAKTGARSIREFVVGVLGPQVTNEVLQQNWGPLLERGERMTVNLSVSSIRPGRPFYEGEEPDEKEAILAVTTSVQGKQVSETRYDFTKKASYLAQASKMEAEATAYHEMAHAVTSFTKVTGLKPVKITIVPELVNETIQAAGYVQYKSVPFQHHRNRAYLVANLAGLMAGSEAEKIFVEQEGFNVGRSNDIERVGKTARKIILDAHLMPELDSAHAYMDSHGDIIEHLPEDLKAKFTEYVNGAIDDARKLALETVHKEWDLIQAGARFLMEFGGNITGDEYDKLVEETAKIREQGKKATDLDLSSIRGYKKPKKTKNDCEALASR